MRNESVGQKVGKGRGVVNPEFTAPQRITENRVGYTTTGGMYTVPVLTPVEYYDKVASGYDSQYDNPLSIAENDYVKRLIQKEIGDLKQEEVVDLGCGTGQLCDLFPEAQNVIGVDVSNLMLVEAVLKHPDKEWVQKDMTDTGLISESADAVFSLFSSVSYVMNLQRVFDEIHRILKPGGTFLIMAYNRYSLRNMLHGFPQKRPYKDRYSDGSVASCVVRFTTQSELIDMTKEGFTDTCCLGLYAGRKLFKFMPHTLILVGNKEA